MKNNGFVPFVSSHRAAPTAIAPAPGPAPGASPLPEAARPFRPLSAGAAAASAPAQPSCEPKVTLEREGERVSRIRIECSCGQTIELACAY